MAGGQELLEVIESVFSIKCPRARGAECCPFCRLGSRGRIRPFADGAAQLQVIGRSQGRPRVSLSNLSGFC